MCQPLWLVKDYGRELLDEIVLHALQASSTSYSEACSRFVCWSWEPKDTRVLLFLSAAPTQRTYEGGRACRSRLWASNFVLNCLGPLRCNDGLTRNGEENGRVVQEK